MASRWLGIRKRLSLSSTGAGLTIDSRGSATNRSPLFCARDCHWIFRGQNDGHSRSELIPHSVFEAELKFRRRVL
jgi:hypothetical protein